MRSSDAEQAGAPASSAAACTARVMSSTAGALSYAAPRPTRTRLVRIRRAKRCGHGERCYGPAMATTQAGKWEAALADYTKESFEADGKRRDVFRLGSGPAVIICSEAPGITPEQAVFGRRVAAAGCTAVMPTSSATSAGR